MQRTTIARLALTGIMLSSAACVGMAGTTEPGSTADSPVVLSLTPANAATDVNPSGPVTISFDRPMMAGMEALVLVHEGSVTGLIVTGTASWSADRTVLTFAPTAPLKARTAYVVHLSPAMRGTNGQRLDLAACARLGGRSVTAGMMGTTATGGMMNGAWGPGMMGDGWRATDGTFGMVFTFTTA